MEETVISIVLFIYRSYKSVDFISAAALIFSTFMMNGAIPFRSSSNLYIVGRYILVGIAAFLAYPIVEWTVRKIYSYITAEYWMLILVIIFSVSGVFLLMRNQGRK